MKASMFLSHIFAVSAFLAAFGLSSNVIAADVGVPIMPGETQCRYELPKHRSWTKQEHWAWKDRICLGKTADMSRYPGASGHCDPKKADSWPKSRNISTSFLKTILNHEPYRSAQSKAGVIMMCANFFEAVDLSRFDIDRPLWMYQSRFRQNVKLNDLRVSGIMILNGSVFDKQFTAHRLKTQNSLFMRAGARFKKGLNLTGSNIGGQFDLSSSRVDGEFSASGAAISRDFIMGG